jgi:hypothetical protein
VQAPEAATRLAPETVREEAAAEPFGEVAIEAIGSARESARGMLEAEDALSVLRERFESTDDPEAQGELAVEALDQVERQLRLTRERRRGLDSIEGRLWARRNRLERFLIHARGRVWWRARLNRERQTVRPADESERRPDAHR